MSVNSHSGRARSKRLLGERAAEVEQRAVLARRLRRGRRGSATRRTCALRSSVGSSANAGGTIRSGAPTTRCAKPGDRGDRALDGVLHAVVVGDVLEDRQVAEVGPKRGVLLDRPHDRFGIRHAHRRQAKEFRGTARGMSERRRCGGF